MPTNKKANSGGNCNYQQAICTSDVIIRVEGDIALYKVQAFLF